MTPLLDVPAGWLLSRIGGVSLSSFPAYVTLLHSPLLRPFMREPLSRLRARAAFYRARSTVPAYQRFLAEHGASSPASFRDVPIMSKDNYIRRNSIEDLCQGGRLPSHGAVIDESSGSTGRPTQWIRGKVERASTRKLIQFSARGTIGTERFILINAFALGSWATGMNVSMAMVDACIVKSVGPDVDKIVNTLEQLGPDYKYVLCGYPPFLKVLVDSTSLDFDRYDITAIVGGEGMSEPMRAHLGRAFRKVVSSFGASDLEINLALESTWSVAIRRAMADDPRLVERLTGRRDVLPMVFQYDPLQVFMENGDEDRLLFTLCRLENVSPRVRYDLNDHGRVLPLSDVARAAEALGIKHLPKARMQLPVLLHWGREEHAVAFYGCKITPEHVQAACLSVSSLAGIVQDHGLRVYDDDGGDRRLEVIVELKVDVAIPQQGVEREFFDRLAEHNQDFRESRRMIPAHLAPRLVIERAGESRLSGQDARIKRRYVVA